ncbi:MAG: PepSY-associated TM helix domain-containing protein [Acidobacteriota bacterium]
MKRLGPFRLRRDAVQRSYDIHSWLGVLGGLVLFICVYSGTLALFERDLIAWERPEARWAQDGAERMDLELLLERARSRLGEEHDLFVMLPTEGQSRLQARSFQDGRVEKIFVDPYTGEVAENEGSTAFEFLTHLHTDLHLPRPYGRYLVGLLGIFLMMSLISGAMAHPRMIKDLFLLRWRPNLRLTASDVHKQVGVWCLTFGSVMAFTGAVIGLLGLFAPVMVLSAFGGDVEKATEAFSGPHFEETGVTVDMLPIVPLLEEVQAIRPGFEITSLFISHWGDETAEVSFNLERAPYRQLTTGETHRVSLVDGRTVYVSTFTERGAGSRLFGAMQPVHYALFGGLGLKMLYFVSGLVLSLGIVTGTVIWLQRRRSRALERRDRYFWLGRLHLGGSLGLVLASAVAIAAGRFVPTVIEPSFWICWGLVLVGAFVVTDGVGFVRAGALVTGAILVAVGVGDLWLSEHLTPAARQVDLVFLALGLLSAAAAMLGPRGRIGSVGVASPARFVTRESSS